MSLDLETVTLGRLLRRAAATWPDRPFLIADDRETTFQAFDREVDRLACALLSLGFGKGDHIALWLTNSADWVRMLFAAARIGMVVIPINTRYKASELEYILRQSDARALLMMDTCWGIDFYGILRSVAPEVGQQEAGRLSLAKLPELRAVALWGAATRPGTLAMTDLLRTAVDEAALAQAEGQVSPRDPALICYTSGTTGYPKGAMHSHIVIKQSNNVADALHMESGEAILGHMPFYHVAGLFMAILPAVLRGMTLVVMPSWDADRALDLVQAHAVAQFGGIPTHYVDCFDAQRARPRDLSSVKAAWIGGASVSPEVVRRAREVLGTPYILPSYGMTETTISTTFARFDDPPNVAEENKGKLNGDFEARIVDPASGRTLGVGEIGELRLRGHIVTMGYYNNAEATRDAFTADGWFSTGDLGAFDADGNLKITGRIKEMFIVGGSNAYPAEIQAHLETHPGVRQALVVGVPHARLGQVGYAFVQREPQAAALTETEIIAHCKGAIADYKVPRYVAFVAEFPMTESGKIKRHELVSVAEADVSARAARAAAS